MKKRSRVIAIAAVTAVFLAAAVVCAVQIFAPRGETVRIVSCGNVVEVIDLAAAADRVFTVESEYGSNTVCISGGKISVTEADCPDKICVRTGELGAVPIICLPHKLVIERVGAGGEVSAW